MERASRAAPPPPMRRRDAEEEEEGEGISRRDTAVEVLEDEVVEETVASNVEEVDTSLESAEELE